MIRDEKSQFLHQTFIDCVSKNIKFTIKMRYSVIYLIICSVKQICRETLKSKIKIPYLYQNYIPAIIMNQNVRIRKHIN